MKGWCTKNEKSVGIMDKNEIQESMNAHYGLTVGNNQV